jgi:RNA polymerase sigma-70 factor (ECF subfamily)
MALTSDRIHMASRSDARARLLSDLATGSARKGYGIAYDLLGNRAEAEEAVQEALVRACESISDLRDPDAAPAWFLRIVTTMCLRMLRRRRLKRTLLGWLPRRPSGAGADQPPEPNVAPTQELPERADIAERMHTMPALPPREELSRREELGALFGRLEELSANQRAALVLRYGHDLPVREIADLLGVEPATAKTHLVRGLARLRDLMEEHR